MTERCPECGHRFDDDGSTEVHAEVRSSDNHGLRVDIECVCDGCETNLIIEDIGADDGVIGRGGESTLLSPFNGRGYRA